MATNNNDLANILRVLAMDAVKAKCGHPGMPMGMADIAEALWRNHLNHNPNNLIGLIEIGLYYLTATGLCSFMLYFIYRDTILV